jgi:hypothetical protein
MGGKGLPLRGRTRRIFGDLNAKCKMPFGKLRAFGGARHVLSNKKGTMYRASTEGRGRPTGRFRADSYYKTPADIYCQWRSGNLHF